MGGGGLSGGGVSGRCLPAGVGWGEGQLRGANGDEGGWRGFAAGLLSSRRPSALRWAWVARCSGRWRPDPARLSIPVAERGAPRSGGICCWPSLGQWRRHVPSRGGWCGSWAAAAIRASGGAVRAVLGEPPNSYGGAAAGRLWPLATPACLKLPRRWTRAEGSRLEY